MDAYIRVEKIERIAGDVVAAVDNIDRQGLHLQNRHRSRSSHSFYS